jgi:two-component SAPR family response regulator
MVADPLSPVDGSGAPVEVLVLGPVEVSGWAVAPRRNVVSALLCYLVHHPGHPVSGDQLHAALWPVGSGGREPSRATLHTYLSELRTALGPGVLPDATTTGGYGIAGGVVDDWSTFTSLVTEAEADPDRAGEFRGQALSLVRGPPFAAATGTIYEWTTTEQHVAAMEVAITQCAHAQVQWCLGRDDHQGAIEAAEIGLLGVPDSYQLHGDLLASARALGDPAALRRATHQARRALGDVEADRLVAQLD